MNKPNRFDAYINANPKKSLQLAIVATGLIWQFPVCLLGIVLSLVFTKMNRASWWMLLGVGLITALIAIAAGGYGSLLVNQPVLFFKFGFIQNFALVKGLLMNQQKVALLNYLHQAGVYYGGFPMLFAGILSATNLIEDNPHMEVIKNLQEGKLMNVKKELTLKQVEKALGKLEQDDAVGTVLGVSKYTGKRVVIPDSYLNQIMLVLGTTGAGKTITLRRFYQRAIKQGYPLIIVDGKPTDENVDWLQAQARKYDRTFYGFNCGNYAHYDPLVNGGYTELKDKIISLKDQWESDYYKSIAEDYLQTTFEVLLAVGQSFDLAAVVNCLSHDELMLAAREVKNPMLLKRVMNLGGYEQKDIKGLQAHLNILIHSELGQYFTRGDNTFSLSQVIDENAVLYFALPALRFPSFSKVLGKLVINDLKATIDRSRGDDKRVFMIFDEFSVFAGEQVLNLVNMGRGKGVYAVFGTQGLGDLDKVEPSFKDQVLNCANTIICHRLNDHGSAETVAGWIGTKDEFKASAQYNPNQMDAGVGTVAQVKEFVVHPDEIKQGLRVGEAFWASKVGAGRWGKVRIIKSD